MDTMNRIDPKTQVISNPALELASSPELESVELIPYAEPMPSLSDWVVDHTIARIVISVLLIAAIIVSFFVLRPHYEDASSWTSTIETIDEKKSNVTLLVVSSAALSATITAIPDDVGTPIAEQLAELTTDLGIVLGVLYLEKYLLTVLSALGFGALVPLSCIGFLVALWTHGRFSSSRVFSQFAVRILLVALAVLLIVPTSVWLTQRVDEIYAQTKQEAPSAEVSETTVDEPATEEPEGTADNGDRNIFTDFINGVGGFVSDTAKKVTDGLTTVTDDIIQKASEMLESAAVMILTSCVIPILVLVAFLAVGHLLLGIDVSAPMNSLARRGHRLVPRAHKNTQLVK